MFDSRTFFSESDLTNFAPTIFGCRAALRATEKTSGRLGDSGLRMTVSQNKDIIKVGDLKFIVAKKAII